MAPVDSIEAIIGLLDRLLKEGVDCLDSIRCTETLFSALRELDQLIGLKSVKLNIIREIKRFLVTKQLRGLDHKSTYKLNAVIYGPPGVGKTELAKILAKIWYGLGLVGGRKITVKCNQLEEESMKRLNFVSEHLTGVLLKLGELKLSDKLEPKDLDSVSTSCEKILANSNQAYELEIDQKETNYEPYILTSRNDFIGPYQGQSAMKTATLLKENRGRVIIVDEAYSLCNGKKDTFGMEALNELIKHITEFPGENILIFTGYKDRIKSSIFKHQEGMERRFSWIFEIPGYSPSELGEIYSMQLSKSHLSLNPTIELDKFFIKHLKNFEAYAGDTEKLAFFTESEFSERCFHQLFVERKKVTDETSVVREDEFKEAVIKFLANKMEKSTETINHSMYL